MQRIQEHREHLLEELQRRKAEYVAGYDLPLNYPAGVSPAAETTNDDGKEAAARLRTSSQFVNARLLEAGLPLGLGPSPNDHGATPASLERQSVSVGRFVRDLEGTGCYDAVQVHIGHSASAQNNDDDGDSDDRQRSPSDYDVTVKLREKKWYKLYVGGGVNSDDLSSMGGASGNSFGSLGGGGATGAALSVLPKLQFETSASLLNLTGFADVSSASYSVDQTGSSTFRFVHDRPLCSYLSRESAAYRWLMPQDPRAVSDSNEQSDGGPEAAANAALDEQQVYAEDDAQYSLGGGSHASLGLHAAFHDVDHESTRSSNKFVRSVSARLAKHAHSAVRAPGIGRRVWRDRTCSWIGIWV